MKVAHPSVLFNLMWCNDVAMAWWVLGYRLADTVRRGGSSIHARPIPVGWRRPAAASSHRWSIARGLARPSLEHWIRSIRPARLRCH